ncbi:MAG TPA: VWA domain-containing protein [Burkholderiales bacterium]|nr:VWA domain-containing protein [Burkholderiales bacterium]
MLIDFFLHLHSRRLPVSVKEYLTLVEALSLRVTSNRVEEFYFLARACLVKNEANYDKFDLAFAEYFRGIEMLPADWLAEIPAEWLRRQAELILSEEDKKLIEALGGWDALMETLRRRLEEQKGRHQGGAKWIGTAGTSPFGAYGYNPEGIRIGQDGGRNRRAVKVWDRREFRNLDDSLELGTRNIKVALRRLRRFAREGAPEELDLDGTIDATARNAGYLDLRMVPERHNAVKVLLFLDVGGSMEDHVRVCEELFSAARSEFKHLEYFYFHNFLYESVWKDSRRRHSERTATAGVLHKYGHDYKLIFVGDATMSPYEIAYPGGSIEHHNEEAGAVWLRRMLEVYAKAAWLNPTPEDRWQYYESIGTVRELMSGRMYPLTLEGLERAMRSLAR